MKAAWLVKNLPHKAKYEKELRAAERTLSRAQVRVRDLESKIKALEEVTEIYEGMPLGGWTDPCAHDNGLTYTRTSYHLAGDGKRRWGHTCLCANRTGEWGLAVNALTDDHRGHQWFGDRVVFYDNEESAVRALKQWVAHGEIPGDSDA